MCQGASDGQKGAGARRAPVGERGASVLGWHLLYGRLPVIPEGACL